MASLPGSNRYHAGMIHCNRPRRRAVRDPVRSAGPAWSQAFPTRTVRIVIPVPRPGGTSDILARTPWRRSSTEEWGQQVIAENRPGAAGKRRLGVRGEAEKAMRISLLINTVGHATPINPAIYPNLPFDPDQGLPP